MITIQQIIIPNWDDVTPSASVELWWMSESDWIGVGGTIYGAGNPETNQTYVQRVTGLTVDTVANTLTIPQHQIPSTRDAIRNPSVRLRAYIMTVSDGTVSRLKEFPASPLNGFTIPATIVSDTVTDPLFLSATWSDLITYSTFAPSLPRPQYYTADDVNNKIAANIGMGGIGGVGVAARVAFFSSPTVLTTDPVYNYNSSTKKLSVPSVYFGTGTHTGGGITLNPPITTPEFVSIASGTSVAPSTNVSPALTVSKIWNGAAAGGTGVVATFYGTHAGGGGAAEMVNIWARQTVAGSISGLYVRAVGEIAGAGQSHFAAAFSMEQTVTNVDRSVVEFNPNNNTGFNAGTDYGTAGNRSNGIGIVAVGDNHHTVAQYIDRQGTGRFYTGIDFRPQSIDSGTKRAIRLDYQSQVVSWNSTFAGDIPLISGSSDGTNDIVLVSPAGRSVVLGSGFLGTTGTTGFFYLAGMAGAPTGVPIAASGRFPLVYDSANDLLKVYNGSWKNVGTGSGTVTNTGTLTSGKLVYGNGGVDIVTGKVSITEPATSAILSFGVDNATLSFQGSGTVVNRDSTDTLTNKTLVAPALGAATGTSLAITNSQNGNTTVSISNVNTGVLATAAVLLTNNLGANAGFFGLAGGNYTGIAILQNRVFFDANANTAGIVLNTESTLPVIVAVNNTERFRIDTDGIPKFSGTNTTGAGSAALGANSPAVTNTAPYTWFKVRTSDGSDGFVPVWK